MSRRKSDQQAARAAKAPPPLAFTPTKQAGAKAADAEPSTKRNTRRSMQAAVAAEEKENVAGQPAAPVPPKERKRRTAEPSEQPEGYKRPSGAAARPVVAQATVIAVAEAAKEAKKALSRPLSRSAAQAPQPEAAASQEGGARVEPPPAKRSRREVRFIGSSLLNETSLRGPPGPSTS